MYEMKNGIIIGGYFIFTIFFIIVTTIYLSFLNFQSNNKNMAQHPKVAYAALPATQNLLKDGVVAKDVRYELLSNFFQKYDSDLLPFASEIIDTADRYGLDFRLVPSIAMQESNLCKKVIKESYNCWGFGIYGDKVKKFKNYSNAIDTVTKTLASDYKAQGLVTPEQIMKKYTPGSNGSWARGVSHFMNQLSID